MPNAAQPRPTANHLPAELLMLVGKIAIQSAYVDMLLGELLGGLKGIKWNDRDTMVHILDTRRKVQDAENIVKTTFQDPERQSMLMLLDRVGDLLADRNLVVHGVIAYAYPEKNLDRPLYVAFRGKYAHKEMPFSKDTLEPIFKDSATGALLPLEFIRDGVVHNVHLPAVVAVDGAESLVAAGRLGLGLIQVPRYHIESDLAQGTLVPVLPDYPPSPTPVSLLYPRNRQLSPRVRVFIDWLVQVFAAGRA